MPSMEFDHTNVFVKHLPAGLDDDGLTELFAPYGTIISAKVMVDYNQGSSLGYGFVRFANPKDADQAVNELTGFQMGNKFLLCKLSNLAPKVTNSEVSENLYIKPLPTSTTDDTLRELFSKFGEIRTSKAMIDRVTGECTQIGFVRFEKQEDATAAMNAMNGQKLAIDQPPLIVRYAETEAQRTSRKSHPNEYTQDSPVSPTAATHPTSTTISTPSTTPAMSPTSPAYLAQPESPGLVYYYPIPPVVYGAPIQYVPMPYGQYIYSYHPGMDTPSWNPYYSNEYTAQY